MLRVPMGRVVELLYRDAAPKMAADTSVLDVTIYGPDGDYYHHPIPNSQWNEDNLALQFMALNDMRPSDFDGTTLDVTDQHWLEQLSVIDGEFRLHQNALNGGTAALEEAEWFAPYDTDKSNSGQSEPIGGGSDDGGGGEFKNSRSGSESYSEQGGQVGVTLADDESDSGFTIEVE